MRTSLSRPRLALARCPSRVSMCAGPLPASVPVPAPTSSRVWRHLQERPCGPLVCDAPRPPAARRRRPLSRHTCGPGPAPRRVLVRHTCVSPASCVSPVSRLRTWACVSPHLELRRRRVHVAVHGAVAAKLHRCAAPKGRRHVQAPRPQHRRRSSSSSSLSVVRVLAASAADSTRALQQGWREERLCRYQGEMLSRVRGSLGCHLMYPTSTARPPSRRQPKASDSSRPPTWSSRTSTPPGCRRRIAADRSRFAILIISSHPNSHNSLRYAGFSLQQWSGRPWLLLCFVVRGASSNHRTSCLLGKLHCEVTAATCSCSDKHYVPGFCLCRVQNPASCDG